MKFLPISDFPQEGKYDILAVFTFNDGTPYYRIEKNVTMVPEYEWIDVDENTKKRVFKKNVLTSGNDIFEQTDKIRPKAFYILPDLKDSVEANKWRGE